MKCPLLILTKEREKAFTFLDLAKFSQRICTHYIDFAEEKLVKKTQYLKAQKKRFFSTLKEKITKKTKRTLHLITVDIGSK